MIYNKAIDNKTMLLKVLPDISISGDKEEVSILKSIGASPIELYTAGLGAHSVFRCESTAVNTTFYSKKYFDKTPIAPSGIADPLRQWCGLFWAEETIQTDNPYNPEINKSLSYLASHKKEQVAPIVVYFTNLYDSLDGDIEERQWILLKSSGPYFTSNHFEGVNKNFYSSVGSSKEYTDFTFSFGKFYEKTDFTEKEASVLTKTASIKGDYNYFDRQYEELIYSQSVMEQYLPNMYVFFAYQDGLGTNQTYENFLTLNGRIKLENHQGVLMGKKENAQLKATPTEKYFSDWCVKHSILSQADASSLAKQFSNIMLTSEDTKKLMSYNQRKEMFPMWMDIEFTTDKIAEFSESLKDTQVMGFLQSSLMEAVRSNSLQQEQTFEAYTEKSSVKVGGDYNNKPNTVYYNEKYYKYYDLDNWMNKFLEADGASVTDEANVGLDSAYSVFLGMFDQKDVISNHPKYKFHKSLLALILKGKINKLIKKHSRSAKEILSGKSCYNETMLYRVDKYEGNGSGTPIQTLYVPNSLDMNVFQYVDTQVKYNKEYTYVIKAYNLVVGNKYKYDELLYNTGDSYSALRIINNPSLRLYETEVYRHTNKVLDNPPIHPDIEFIPYKGVNDKIKIIMNSGIGRYELASEYIEFEEQQQISEFKKAQNRTTDDVKIKYETDDYPAFYEVRRMEKKPYSYRDFSGKLIHQISTFKNGLIASGVSVDDKIVPNKKYYYCIRAVDNHGHVSYPTPIYEVEMVDDKGSVYPLINVVDFDVLKKSQTSLAGRRYIHISPSLPQRTINYDDGLIELESVKNVKDVTLGIADETVWGRKFKIRLISKSTGRKIDFNVKFNHEHKKYEQEN